MNHQQRAHNAFFRRFRPWCLIGLIWLLTGCGSVPSSSPEACATEGLSSLTSIQDTVVVLSSLYECIPPSRLPLAVLLLSMIILLYQFVSGPLTRRSSQTRFRNAVLALKLLIVMFGFYAIVLTITPDDVALRRVFYIIGTIVVVLALREPFSNFLAGLAASVERSYGVGDWIEVDGQYGRITHVGFRSVKLETPGDSTVIISHRRLLDATIVNANSGAPTHQCIANFYVQGEHDLRVVRRILWDVAMTSPYTLIQSDYPVTVVVAERPFGMHYRIKAYPRFGSDEFLFISDMTIRGREALKSLEIPLTSLHVMPDAS